MTRRHRLPVALCAVLATVALPLRASAQDPSTTTTAGQPTSTTAPDSPYDAGAAPTTTSTTASSDGTAETTPPAPEPAGDLPGYTGGGQVIGDNPVREIRTDRFERPVLLHPDDAAEDTTAQAAEAARRAVEAADAATAATAAREGARSALDQLGTNVMIARQRLDKDIVAEANQRRIVGQLAVAFYVKGVQVPDLASELTEPGLSTERVSDQVTTQSALEHHTGLLHRSERTREASAAYLDGLLAAFPSTRAHLAEAEEALTRAEAAVVKTRGDAAALATRAERAKAGVDQAAVDAVGSTGPVTFPVAGPWDYIDSWGYPRSGGRRHKGTDVFAPSGTPLVAIESGVVKPDADPLGGLVVYLEGGSGNNYYYAHLKAIAPAVVAAGDRGLKVDAGDLVGWVGNSGNAYDTPAHLHIQFATRGYAWQNPYPVLRALAEGVMAARSRGALPTLDVDLVEDLDVDELTELLTSGAALSPETEASLDRVTADHLVTSGVLARPVTVVPLPELMSRVPPAVDPVPDPSTYPTTSGDAVPATDPSLSDPPPAT